MLTIGVTNYHACLLPECNECTYPRLLYCSEHSGRIPEIVNSRLWSHYRPTEDQSPVMDAEFLRVKESADRHIRAYYEPIDGAQFTITRVSSLLRIAESKIRKAAKELHISITIVCRRESEASQYARMTTVFTRQEVCAIAEHLDRG